MSEVACVRVWQMPISLIIHYYKYNQQKISLVYVFGGIVCTKLSSNIRVNTFKVFG